jgi:hypothetical protein
MSKLVSLLCKEPLTLIVKLSGDPVEMAKAAEEGGADAVCADFSGDMDAVKKIVESVKIPVGILVEENVLTEADIEHLKNICIDFMDIPLGGVPENALKSGGFGRIFALGPDYDALDLTRLSDKPIDGLDAAIILEEEWGKDLTVGDLQQLITIAMSTALPVIVPTQKTVRASEVPIIWDTGAKGIMIGETVTGETPASLKAVTREFKSAIEALKE